MGVADGVDLALTSFAVSSTAFSDTGKNVEILIPEANCAELRAYVCSM